MDIIPTTEPFARGLLFKAESDRGPEGRRAARIIYEALFRAAEDREDRERIAGNISGYLFGSPTLVEWFKRTYPDEAQVIEDATQ